MCLQIIKLKNKVIDIVLRKEKKNTKSFGTQGKTFLYMTVKQK